MSAAMSEFPHLFSELQIEFVKNGELTGNIGDMMLVLSSYLEDDYQLRQIIRSETWYPKTVFVCSLFLPNLATLIVSGWPAYEHQVVLPVAYGAAILLALWMAGRYGLRSRPISYGFDWVKAHFPHFGWTVRLLAFSKFLKSLSALYASGVFIPTALQVASRVAGNQWIASKVASAVADIKAGGKLTNAFARVGIFPPLLLSMLRTGEETGNLSEVLTKLAQYYEDEAKIRLHISCKAIGVAALILVGILVGIQVISFYTGYFTQMLNF
jgi:type II secretory pathway component PulF